MIGQSVTAPGQTGEQQSVHWADAVAAGIADRRPGRHIVATGITPSGPIHLGNLREVLTADAVYRALLGRQVEAELIYLADTFDPLRRVYPFLPQSYEEHIGKPLYAIPDPEGCCESYSEHFLGPFLVALERLGIQPTVHRVHELYRQGAYTEVTRTALLARDRVAAILEEVSGRGLPEGWYPYQPLCTECGRISENRVLGVSSDGLEVEYECACGHRGVARVEKGEGKLPWRVDWPARWKALGVTVEPFGKDHASAGGSYETGTRLVREIFDYTEPEPISYEWIYLKGQGAMASSTGVAVSVSDLLEILPPETIRFLIVRSRPEKHIEFEPSNGLLNVMDEFHDAERRAFTDHPDRWNRRVYELAMPGRPAPVQPMQIPYIHIAVATQAAGREVQRTLEVLGRTGYPVSEDERPRIAGQIRLAHAWIDRYAPEAYRFAIQADLPPEAADLTADQAEFLRDLAGRLELVDWHPEGLHAAIHDAGKDRGLSAKAAFQAVYLILIGKKHGPRAGYFLASLDRELVVSRIGELPAVPS